MRITHAVALSALVVVAACAGPAEVRRAEPPRATTSPVALRLDEARPQQELDEAATQRWLAGEVAAKQQGASGAAPAAPVERVVPTSDRGLSSRTDEAATKAWLQQTIDERRAMEDQNLPPPPPVLETQTVYVDRYVGRYDFGYGYDCYGNPVFVGDPWCQPYRRSSFPVFTAAGATIGAFARGGDRARGRDIALGAGIGLLFDLGNWCR